MKDKTLRILVVEPMKKPHVRVIPHTLEAMQAVVGGYIQSVPVLDLPGPVDIICNDEGKLMGLTPNRVLKDETGMPYDIVCGTFFVVGASEEDFVSLTDEQIATYMDKYSREMVFVPPGRRDDPRKGGRGDAGER